MPRRLVRLSAWTAAVILTTYGGVLTAGGWLVMSGVVPASADADRRAITWHAALWDPWCLVWGLLLPASLIADRRGRRSGAYRTPVRIG